MLYTKGIYLPKARSDGFRICIMSRLTENDGKTPVPALVKGQLFDEWRPYFAAPDHVVGAWYRGKQDDDAWEEYTFAYAKHLKQPSIELKVIELAGRALLDDVTILCVEPTPQRCHRSLLAKACQEYFPELEVEHLLE